MAVRKHRKISSAKQNNPTKSHTLDIQDQKNWSFNKELSGENFEILRRETTESKTLRTIVILNSESAPGRVGVSSSLYRTFQNEYTVFEAIFRLSGRKQKCLGSDGRHFHTTAAKDRRKNSTRKLETIIAYQKLISKFPRISRLNYQRTQ